MAAQLVNTHISTPALGRTCALCHSGIPWDVTFADCTYCRLPFCKHCWLQHQPSHALASVSMVHGDIHDATNKVAPQPCSACRKRSASRYACLECPYTLCRGCWFSRGVNTHPHRSFKIFEPTCSTGRVTAADTLPTNSCCDDAAVNHCVSCSKGFALGQSIIFCKTCFVDINEPMYRCLSCYSLGHGHPSHHEPWQWTFQVAKTGWLSSGIYCQKCAQPMRTVEALKGHAHTDFIDVYTEDNLNQVIARSYRECQRKVMRVDGLVTDVGEQCSLCLHKTTPISSLHCQQCNQVLKLCTHCVQYASKLHVHPIPRFNDDTNQAQPGEILQSPVSPGSFQSPQSPYPPQRPFSATAAPQSQWPGHAANAHPTAGLARPPPGQRICSAPPHTQWSRPQSHVPGQVVRPGGPAQQHNFFNELATSIAVASITNAVVAGQSNAIYGGSDSTGAANGGNFDTSTTAVDPMGINTTQDASGAQGMDWSMGQDTAVYDSGWAMDNSAQFDSGF
ncbi:hypothetical protein FOPE_02268 [Fonsecaea pedrosoi]|nr:hypothetical protein FOPE_02268 [Fonsecaea pedrosoi]